MPTLAVEQPGYIPNIEFFFKMISADVFVLADNFQYISHGFINRTRIKTANGPAWLTVPVLTKGQRRQSINKVRIDLSHAWCRNHWRTLEVNYCMTPYFDRYSSFLEKSFRSQWNHLLDINLHFIQYFANELLFDGRLELGSHLPNTLDRSQRVINWLQQMKCDQYLVSEKGKSLIDEKLIRKEGFEVTTYTFNSPTYYQQFGPFVHGLSIIDLLCNEGPESLRILKQLE